MVEMDIACEGYSSVKAEMDTECEGQAEVKTEIAQTDIEYEGQTEIKTEASGNWPDGQDVQLEQDSRDSKGTVKMYTVCVLWPYEGIFHQPLCMV